MCNSKITFKSIDSIINILREKYTQNGIKSIQDWVKNTFKQNQEISIARDLNDLSKIDHKIIYDRVIIKLNELGEETTTYYLDPINQDIFEHNLFISIRLNFIEEPFELLIFTN